MAHILLVDDDPQFQLMTKTMLTKAGYTVTQASNGVEAINAFKTGRAKFDLIISDVMMPDMDGVDLLSQLKDMGVNLPVLAISGGIKNLSAGFNLSSMTMLGAVDTLAKPFSKSDLLTKVEALIG
jgi:CheY-like chemotaxis protein